MTFTKEQLQHIIETEHVQCGDASALARMALAGMEAEPVAWSVGGIATHDKKWATRRGEEDNLLMEPLYRHPIITGIDENHYDPELEPGLYVAEIMTKGGAAIINGYYSAPQPATVAQPVSVPDEIQKMKDGRGFKYVKDGIRYSVNYANGWNQCRAAMLQGVGYR